MPECFTWSQTSDKSITGLCSMELLRETSANMRNGCPVCIEPLSLRAGACVPCLVSPPPLVYRVNITAGMTLPNTLDASCMALYNREFLVVGVRACEWESYEREVGIYAEFLTTNFLCVYHGYMNRARVSLRASAANVGGTDVIKWTAEIRYRSSPILGTLFIDELESTAVGYASNTDCEQPVNLSIATSDGINISATIRPLS